jgi:hypothetical protein
MKDRRNVSSMVEKRPAIGQKIDIANRPDYVDTITILAGEDERPFTVHKNIICNRSPYFVAASWEAWQQQ